VIASRCTEASPIVLREALASGRPLVATKVGDIPEVIQDGENGLLVERGAADEMAAAILRFIFDEKLAARCAANGLALARKRFSFDRMMQAKMRVDAALIDEHDEAAALVPSPTPALVQESEEAAGGF
jgi:glycosyltransferase involved in cell wall biosynthesis